MLTARGGSRLPLMYNKKIGYHQRAFRGIRLLWLLSKIVSYFFIKKKAPSQGIFSLLFAASEGKEKTSRNQTREDAQGHGRSLTLTRAPGWDSLLGQVHRRVPWLWETRPRTWPISVGLPLVKTRPSSNIIRLIAGRSQRKRSICVTKEWLTECYLYPAPMEHLYCLKIKYQVESEAEINGRNQSGKEVRPLGGAVHRGRAQRKTRDKTQTSQRKPPGEPDMRTEGLLFLILFPFSFL